MAVSECPSNFIGELCVALAHRWEPERLFVIFTAYFDESDTHGAAPTVVLAAYVGHAFQWHRFEKKLLKLQKKYGFKVFHSKDFRKASGEFSGWSEQKRQALLQEMIELVRDKLEMGVVVSLSHERFVKEYRSPPIPKKMNLDSQYGACFRACLGYLLKFVEKRGNTDRLHVVFEGGHKNVGDCERIFHDLKKRWRKYSAGVLGSFTIETKDSCAPLMVADILAYSRSMMNDMKEDRTLPPGAMVPFTGSRGGWHLIELAPNALAELKENFEKLRQLEIEKWRAERDARRDVRCES